MIPAPSNPMSADPWTDWDVMGQNLRMKSLFNSAAPDGTEPATFDQRFQSSPPTFPMELPPVPHHIDTPSGAVVEAEPQQFPTDISAQSAPPVPASTFDEAGFETTEATPVESPTPFDLPAGTSETHQTPFDTPSGAEWAGPPGSQQFAETDQSIKWYQNAQRAFGSSLAAMLDLPLNQTMNLMDRLIPEWEKTLIKNPKADSAEFRNVVSKTAKAAGIRIDPVETLSKDLGEGLFMGLITYGAMWRAAPWLASRTGTGFVSRQLRNLGESIQKHPAYTAMTEMAASVGGEMGETKGGLPGAVAGSMAGGIVSGTALRAGSRVAQAARDVRSALMPNTAPMGPVRSHTPSSDDIAANAKLHVEGEQGLLNSAFADTLDNISVIPDSRVAQAATQEAVQGYATAARRLVDRYWSKVPKNLRIPNSDLKNQVLAVGTEEEIKLVPEFFPTDIIKRMEALDESTSTSMGTVIKLQTLLRTTARKERAEKSPNMSLVRNIERIQDNIYDYIAHQFPDMPELARAREMSNWQKTTFRNGPIGEILARNHEGGTKIDPELAVSHLLKRHRGLEAINALNRPQVTQRTEQALRDMWRQSLDAIPIDSPSRDRRIAQMTSQFERQTKPMARVAAEFDMTAERYRTLIDRREALQKSAVAQISGMDDPRQGVMTMMTDPVKGYTSIKNLWDTAANAPVAREAIKNFVIDGLQNEANMSPTAMKALLQRDNTDRILRTVLSTAEYGRLSRIVDAASRVERSSETYRIMPRNLLGMLAAGGAAGSAMLDPVSGMAAAGALSVGKLSGRILGAYAFRNMAHMVGGGGTIQIPAAGAQAGMRLAEKAFSAGNPSMLMRLGVVDPWWEARLLRREELTTIAEVKQLQKQLARRVGIIESANQATLKHLLRPEEEE